MRRLVMLCLVVPLLAVLAATVAESADPVDLDYNCGLPTKGYHWIEYQPHATPSGLVDEADWPTIMVARIGVFRSLAGYELGLPLEGGPDGVLNAAGFVDFVKVYQLLCRVHPDLGGSGLRPLTSDEKAQLGDLATGDSGAPIGRCTFQPKNMPASVTDMTEEECFEHRWGFSMECGPESGCEVVERRRPTWVPGPGAWADYYTDSTPSMDGQPMRLYWLPSMSQELKDALGEERGTSATKATATEAKPSPSASTAVDKEKASPSPRPSPSPKPETRRYRVIVKGQETNIPDQFWRVKGDVRKGARFDYRLVGEFELKRSDASQPWKVASERLIKAEVRPSSLFPKDRYQLRLSCPKCDRLEQAVRLYVTVERDEVVIGWRPFFPEIRLFGTCTGCERPVDFHLESDYFWSRISGTRLPLKDSYTTAPTNVTNASGDITISYTHGLERRP